MTHRSIRWAILVSLFLHLLAFMPWVGMDTYAPNSRRPKPFVVSLVEPDLKKQRSQVVTSNAEESPAMPKANAYLSDANRSVDRETVAANRGQNQKSAEKRPMPPSLKALGLAGLSGKALAKVANEAQREVEQHDFTQEFGNAGGDYVSGVPDANRTALNTREFVFFGYFKRVRVQLDQAWQPLIRNRLNSNARAGRFLANDSDHITRTLVTMNERGEIVRVQVVDSSGTKDLDDVAVKAFNQAGPFPNPPRGLVDSSGEVVIRWDFILKS